MVIAVDITWRGLGSFCAQVPRREGKVHLNFILAVFLSLWG